MTSSPIFSVLRRVYGVLRVPMAIVIFAWLAYQIWAGRAEIAKLAFTWRPFDIFCAFIATITAYQLLFFGWVLILRRSGLYAPEQRGLYARVWWLSYLYRYVPGKILLLVERARLGAPLGIPPASGAVFPIIETLVALLAGIAVSLLSVAYFASAADVLLPAAVMAAVLLFLVPAGYRQLARLPFLRNRYPDLQSVALGTTDLLVVSAPYIAHYLLLGVAFFLIARSVYPFTWLDFPGLCGMYAMSHVVSLIVVIAPAGLGVREGALAVLLARAVPVGLASALAVAVRVAFTLIELLCFLAIVLLVSPGSTVPATGRRHETP